MRALKKLLVSVGLAGYFFLTLFGLLVLSSMHQHDMSSMNNCPYMIGEQALCTMNFTEHINAWKELSNFPTVNSWVLATPVLFVFFFFYLRPPNLARYRLHINPLRQSYISDLFSKGILNPKAP